MAMQLWECTYKVVREIGSFRVKDYIWSTTEPADGVGHYWSHGFGYTIEEQKVRLIENHDGSELVAHMYDFEYKEV